MSSDKQHAQHLLNHLAPDQVAAVVHLMQVMLHPLSRQPVDSPIEDEGISEEEKQTVARSKEWFKHNEGLSFEQVVTDLGFTMDQIRTHRLTDDEHPAT